MKAARRRGHWGLRSQEPRPDRRNGTGERALRELPRKEDGNDTNDQYATSTRRRVTEGRSLPPLNHRPRSGRISLHRPGRRPTSNPRRDADQFCPRRGSRLSVESRPLYDGPELAVDRCPTRRAARAAGPSSSCSRDSTRSQPDEAGPRVHPRPHQPPDGCEAIIDARGLEPASVRGWQEVIPEIGGPVHPHQFRDASLSATTRSAPRTPFRCRRPGHSTTQSPSARTPRGRPLGGGQEALDELLARPMPTGGTTGPSSSKYKKISKIFAPDVEVDGPGLGQCSSSPTTRPS